MVEQEGLRNGSPPAGPVHGLGRGGDLGAKPPEAIGTMKYCAYKNYTGPSLRCVERVIGCFCPSICKKQTYAVYAIVMGDDPAPTDPIFIQLKRCWRVRKLHDIGDDVAGPWGQDSAFEFRRPGPILILIRKDVSKSPLRLAMRSHCSGHGVVPTHLAGKISKVTSIGDVR